jgi:hypothetical protein
MNLKLCRMERWFPGGLEENHEPQSGVCVSRLRFEEGTHEK